MTAFISIANPMVLEQAAACGIKIRFRQYAAVGLPVTALSLTILIFWIYI